MLISLSHKFIFVANLKTASTSIEFVLKPYAEICIPETGWGKHQSLYDIEIGFASVFKFIPRQEFRVIAVLRDPEDWLLSLYRSHKAVRFEQSVLSTSGMTWDEFLENWCAINFDQTLAQTHRLLNFYGILGADFIMRFHELPNDFRAVCDLLDIASPDDLPHFNVSGSYAPIGNDDIRESIHYNYKIDYHVLRNLSGRLLGDEDRRINLEKMPVPVSFSSQRSVQRSRPLTSDDVTWAYRILLGRDPESEGVIRDHLQATTLDELRARIMGSDEFSRKISRLAS